MANLIVSYHRPVPTLAVLRAFLTQKGYKVLPPKQRYWELWGVPGVNESTTDPDQWVELPTFEGARDYPQQPLVVLPELLCTFPTAFHRREPRNGGEGIPLG